MLQNRAAEVEPAATTKDARRAMKLNAFDAAVLDVNLHRETSCLLAEELRERAIPFVFATGYGETIVVPNRFKGVRVVAKPYAEDALRAAYRLARLRPTRSGTRGRDAGLIDNGSR